MNKRIAKALCGFLCCAALLTAPALPAYGSHAADGDLRSRIEATKQSLSQMKAPPNLLLEKQDGFLNGIRKFVAVGLQKGRLEEYNDYYYAARSCYSSAMTQLNSALWFLEDGYEGIAELYLEKCNEYVRMGSEYDNAALYIWRGNLEAAKEKLYYIGKVSANVVGLSGKVLGKIGAKPIGFIFDKGAIGLEYWIDSTYKDAGTADRNLYKNATEFLFNKAYSSWLSDAGIQVTEEGVGLGRSGLSLLGLNVPAADMMFETPPEVFCSDTCKLIRSFIKPPEGFDRLPAIRELAGKTGLSESEVARIVETFETANGNGTATDAGTQNNTEKDADGEQTGENTAEAGETEPAETAVTAASVEGKYYPVEGTAGKGSDSSGSLTDTMNDYLFSSIDWIEFKGDGKMRISVMGVVQTGDYEVLGDTVYATNPGQGEVEFTIIDADTLHGENTGFIGDFSKKD